MVFWSPKRNSDSDQDTSIRAIPTIPILFVLKTTMHICFFAWRKLENKENMAIGLQ